MTFPALGSGSNSNPSDPTVTGSVTLTPADFGGTFPSGPIPVAVMWVNQTIGSQIVAPSFMRTMTVFVEALSSNQ
jgi:hypothetical protein